MISDRLTVFNLRLFSKILRPIIESRQLIRRKLQTGVDMVIPTIHELDTSQFEGLKSEENGICTVEATVPTGTEDVRKLFNILLYILIYIII